MGDILVRVRILPEDVETEPEDILASIRSATSSVATLLRYKVEPIAFGLNALMVDFGVEDKEGGTDPLEAALMACKGVSQVDVVGVSRASTKLK